MADDDRELGTYLGEARHPPSFVLPIAAVFFGLLGCVGIVGIVRGELGTGVVFLVLFGGIALIVWGLAFNRLHVWERGMEMRGPFGTTRMAFADVTAARTLMGGRGVRRPIATEYKASASRRISVSTSWNMPDAVKDALHRVAMEKSSA